jgi:hypothetical protein
MSVFNVFFDSPASRPHRSFISRTEGKTLRVLAEGARASVSVGPVSSGPFRGEWVITAFGGTGLIQVEAVLTTLEDRVAFLYDAGLVGPEPLGQRVAWVDTTGTLRSEPANPAGPDRAIAVRHRAIAAESAGGTLVVFPPPHQYFFPRDETDNLSTVWVGRGHRGLGEGHGIGIRQAETGGGRYSPWFSAPPSTAQRLSIFYGISREPAEAALGTVRKLTHDDRFVSLPGYQTFSSHWHMAFTVEAMKQQAQGVNPLPKPSFVDLFKTLGVDAVHVAEFHGDGHPGDPGPVRLAELSAMFAECRRLSDDRLLLIPGEEANIDLGQRAPGRPNPGHWLEMFPRPVFWTMNRAPGQPFVENDPKYGPVYHVGSTGDLVELLEREQGLAWTAHPRIKASNFAPDVYRDEEFFRGSSWLGAAWKAMPADLSSPRLGDRVLNLFDDMNNWGARKQVLGEVDVFKIDPTHELYGHMNVNYVKLDRLPRFDEGWRPLLEALRAGRFFVTTGEVLFHSATIGGVESGGTLEAAKAGPVEVRAEVSWTFPLRAAEVVSGDGQRTYRDRFDLSSQPAFGRQTLVLPVDLTGRTWARLEVWDVATNGGFTQPVWVGRQP